MSTPASHPRDIPTAQPRPEAIAEMPIRRATWREFQTRISRLNHHSGTVALNLAFFWFGAAITVAVAFMVIKATDTRLKRGMEPVFWVVIAALGVCATLCLAFHFILAARHKGDVKQISDDMMRVEQDYEWDGQAAPATGTDSPEETVAKERPNQRQPRLRSSSQDPTGPRFSVPPGRTSSG